MGLNENIVKNIANEIVRNCQAQNVIVDSDFVAYFIEMLLLNPKYGLIFTKSFSRNHLDGFVNVCVSMLIHGEVFMITLKMQHIMVINYDKHDNLIDRHRDSIKSCLRPLLNEILEADPDADDEVELNKLYRKISIYFILASGLGNPNAIMILKESVAALESVYSIDDLKITLGMTRAEKIAKLIEIKEIVSGVKLFNRDSKKSGEGITDLPLDLVDAANACQATLSNSLMVIMERVNSLTTAIEDVIDIEEETGNIYVNIPANTDITRKDYQQVFDQLIFNRQYEIIVRRLLMDIEIVVQNSVIYVERFKNTLEQIHTAVKYKSAVPVATVFPLFTKLWNIWEDMQNEMYLVSIINRLMSTLSNLQEKVRHPAVTLKKLLRGRPVITDYERLASKISLDDKLSLMCLRNFVSYSNTGFSIKEKYIQYLGFCSMCLCVGALIPCNPKLGMIRIKGDTYGFCNAKMGEKFSKNPQRYINEALEFVRNSPHLINLLNLVPDVTRVQHIEFLATKVLPKIKLFEKDIQTEAHPHEENIVKNYSWNLWEHKRRACQWSNIVNCQTHSTQTIHSHLRSEIHCQTVDMRDKCLQTKKDGWTNVPGVNAFLWGLRGRLKDDQHNVNLTENVERKNLTEDAIIGTDANICDELSELNNVTIDESITEKEVDIADLQCNTEKPEEHKEVEQEVDPEQEQDVSFPESN